MHSKGHIDSILAATTARFWVFFCLVARLDNQYLLQCLQVVHTLMAFLNACHHEGTLAIRLLQPKWCFLSCKIGCGLSTSMRRVSDLTMCVTLNVLLRFSYHVIAKEWWLSTIMQSTSMGDLTCLRCLHRRMLRQLVFSKCPLISSVEEVKGLENVFSWECCYKSHIVVGNLFGLMAKVKCNTVQ